MERVRAMTEYKTGNACVRIHGGTDRKKLQEATIRFLQQVELHRRKEANEKRKETDKRATEVDRAMGA